MQLLDLYISFSLLRNCPLLEFSWSAFSRIRTKYGNLLSPNVGKCGPEKLQMRTIFTQCSTQEDGFYEDS